MEDAQDDSNPGTTEGTLPVSAAAEPRPPPPVAAAAELREDDAQLQDLANEHFALVGALTAGAAHEVNNALSAMLCTLEVLSRSSEDDAQPEIEAPADAGAPGRTPAVAERRAQENADPRELLADIRKAAGRVREVVRRIGSLQGSAMAGPLELRPTLEAALNLVASGLRTRVRGVRGFEGLPKVVANEQALLQLFAHLVSAVARPAGPAHATGPAAAKESGRPPLIEEVAVRISAGLLSDGRVTLDIAGPGVLEGRLRITRGLLALFGGGFEISRSNDETAVRLYFRVADRPADQATGPEPPARLGLRTRVLVVDDDELVGTAVRRALAVDHDVEIACDPRAALDRLIGGEPFAAIICDLLMPQLSGMEFYEAVRREAPHLADRIIFLTGGSFAPNVKQFMRRVPNQRIDKPFQSHDLRIAIGRVADTATRSPDGRLKVPGS